jgi:TonB-dependent receptor
MVLLIKSSLGQVKYIKISGIVNDMANGNPLVGASVLLESSKAGVKTDVDGNFFMNLETGKTYNLLISNIGYQTKMIENVKPGNRGNQPITVSLQHVSATLENVVIRSNSHRESTASIYAAQKNSSSISDAISAESIRKSPDRNTSEVLRRVSGASVQENKFVIIRGLNERYNSSLLNNTVLPSTEPDKKAFSFDIIPASLIDNVTIYKSPTPDLPGDFAGGAVKITTKDYPSKPVSDLTLTLGYNSLTTFKGFYKGVPAGQFDAIGYFSNSRQMPGGYYNNRGAEFINLTDPQKIAITKQFPNDFAYEQANNSQPNFSLSYTGGNTKLIGENKFGYIYTVAYTSGRRVIDRTRNEYESYTLPDYNYNTTNYDIRSIFSAMVNLTYSYRKSKISWKNFFNNDFNKSVALRTGVNTVNTESPFNYKGESNEANGNGIGSSVLEGLHNLNHDWTINWSGSFSLTYRWQPDQTIVTFHTDPNSSHYYLSLSNENSPDIINAGRVYSYLTEYIYGANINATKLFTWNGRQQKLKLGTANYFRDRSVEVDAMGYASLDAGFGTIHIPETKDITFSTIFDPTNVEAFRMVVANIGTNSTDYTGKALLNAGYAMMDNNISDKIKLTWGLRVENYSQQLVTPGKPNVDLNNLDLLPSFIFTYALNKKTNLRAAASQSVNRPEFRELATYRVYDYENNYYVLGNDTLKRSKNINADLRYEFFPASGEIISASVFYKNFDQPIEQTNQGNSVLSFANADGANVYGVEMEIRKNLGFIRAGFFDNLVIYANAAFMKGSVQFNGITYNNPMQGQSPYLVNGGLGYSTDNNSLSFNVLYNIIGPRLKYRAITSSGGAGNNIYEAPRNVLDFQVSKRLMNNKLELKLTVGDILAEPYTWYMKFQADPKSITYDASQDKIVNTYKFGTTVLFSIAWSL